MAPRYPPLAPAVFAESAGSKVNGATDASSPDREPSGCARATSLCARDQRALSIVVGLVVGCERVCPSRFQVSVAVLWRTNASPSDRRVDTRRGRGLSGTGNR